MGNIQLVIKKVYIGCYMKKILFISAFVPSNATAGQAYSERFISQLKKDGHEVDIYAFYNGYQDPRKSESYQNIIKLVEVNLFYRLFCFISCFFIHPLFSSRFNPYHLFELRRIASGYDCLYFDFSQVFLYSLFIDHKYKVLMAHDVVSQKFKREIKSLRKYLEYQWAEASESILLRGARQVFTFSQKDSILLKEAFAVESKEVPFFIDTVIKSENEKKGDEDFFVFYGVWSRKENLDSLLYFLASYQEFSASHKFKIIGGGLPEVIMGDITQRGLDFEYLGFVQNPYRIISKATALIAPLRLGAGVKVKVIESLACGVPVIGTDVAFEGIPTYASEFCFDLNDKYCFEKSIEVNDLMRGEFKKSFLERYESSHPFLQSFK